MVFRDPPRRAGKRPTDALMFLHALRARDRRNYARRWPAAVRQVVLFVLSAAIPGAAHYFCAARGPLPATEIYRGVTYLCERLPETAESGGLLRLVRVDLSESGVELYITPPASERLSREWRYRLRYVGEVVQTQNLAVAVNATMFHSDSLSVRWQEESWPIRRAGDPARSTDRIIANYVVGSGQRNKWLLWFEEDLTPHIDLRDQVTPEVLKRAKWGIGAWSMLVKDRAAQTFPHPTADRRTVIGVNLEQRVLWLAIFDRASRNSAAQALASRGVQYAIMVDGGSSTAMVLGAEARGARPGVVTGDWFPVATHLGVRAEPLSPRPSKTNAGILSNAAKDVF
jgi:hypothetical protein